MKRKTSSFRSRLRTRRPEVHDPFQPEHNDQRCPGISCGWHGQAGPDRAATRRAGIFCRSSRWPVLFSRERYGCNFRIVSAPDSDPENKNWSELIATRDDVQIDDFDLFAHNLVLTERHNGLPQLALAKLPDGTRDPAANGKLIPPELTFKEPDYTVAMGTTTSSIRRRFGSLTPR